MLIFTSSSGTLSMRATSRRSRSMSSPFLPMTMPGRAVWIVMCTRRAGRSILMRLTDACDRRSFEEPADAEIRVQHTRRNWRVSAYHLELHSWVMPRRSPDRI